LINGVIINKTKNVLRHMQILRDFFIGRNLYYI